LPRGKAHQIKRVQKVQRKKRGRQPKKKEGSVPIYESARTKWLTTTGKRKKGCTIFRTRVSYGGEDSKKETNPKKKMKVGGFKEKGRKTSTTGVPTRSTTSQTTKKKRKREVGRNKSRVKNWEREGEKGERWGKKGKQNGEGKKCVGESGWKK